MKHKKRHEPKIVRTADYNCAYVMVTAPCYPTDICIRRFNSI